MFLSVVRLQQVREKKRDCFAPQIVAPYSVKLLFPAAIGPSITIILHKFNMTVLGYVQICTISHIGKSVFWTVGDGGGGGGGGGCGGCERCTPNNGGC